MKTPPSVNRFIYKTNRDDLKTSFERKIGSIGSDQKSERFVHLETGYVRSRDRGGKGGREREREKGEGLNLHRGIEVPITRGNRSKSFDQTQFPFSVSSIK